MINYHATGDESEKVTYPPTRGMEKPIDESGFNNGIRIRRRLP